MFDIFTFRYFRLQLFSLSCLLFPGSSFADDICLDMHVIQSVPLGFYDENNKAAGLHIEVLQEIEKYSGICMTKRIMPIARIWKSIEEGKHDGGLILKSSARSHLVEYVAFTRNIETIVIPRKGLNIENYKALHNMSIAKTRGTPLSNSFDRDNKLNIVEVTSYGQVVEMLKYGRIDAVAGGAAPIFYHLSAYEGIQNEMDVGNKFILGSREQWLQFSKKSANLDQIPKLQKATELMMKNGDYDRIMLKYYGKIAEFVAGVK
jgi:polar amino acid transport system substrate-binding protein